jgi:hypothetical protein
MHDHWADVLRIICCAFIAAVSTVFGNLAIAYGKEVGLNESITLWLVVVASFFALSPSRCSAAWRTGWAACRSSSTARCPAPR